MPELDELRERLQIDRYALDEGVIEQPAIFAQVSEEAVLARSRADEAKENLKRVDAELESEIREALEHQKQRATESMISALVIQRKEHKEAFKDHLEKRQYAEECEALKQAFQQRSYMLRELIELYIAGYYTDNAIKSDHTTAQHVEYASNRSKLAEGRKSRQKERSEKRTDDN